MRRRLDLAASLIAAPPVIFLDEPTTGLDPRSRIKMWDVIKKLVADGVTILLTTQYLDEADQLADRVAVIDTGKVIAEGTPDELKSQIGDDRVEFTYTDEATLHRAAEVLSDLEPTVNEKKLQLTIPNARGVEGVRDMLDRLGDNGASAAGINIHKPTLDDVFLKLTGKTTTNEQDGEEGS
jgi:ABC-2 type transport system ATP-binding protein